MDGFSPVQEYRLLDALYANTDCAMHVHDALVRLRREQLEARSAALKGGLALIALFLLSVVPTLLELLPDESRGTRGFVWAAIIIGVLLLCYLGFDLYGNWRERRAVDQKLHAESGLAITDQPRYLLSQLTFWGTRLSVAGDVLNAQDIDANTRAKFARVEEWCRSEIEGVLARAKALNVNRQLTGSEYSLIQEWATTALRQSSRRGESASE